MGSAPSPNPSLLPEIGPDGLSREAPVIAYTEKIIEAEQLQLRKYIDENYSKIRDVERELASLNMELKLTAGPKKAALEHLRKKIEISTEKIRLAKVKEEEARKMWEAASKVVKDEEEAKQKLCDDLNQLVQESSQTQFARLEELKRRLEALNPGRASSAAVSHDGVSTGPPPTIIATDASSATNSTEAGSGGRKNITNEGNSGNTQALNVINQHISAEGEGRGRKKNQFQGKGRGLGAVPKGKGPPAPGWTGAGFDVDGRT